MFSSTSLEFIEAYPSFSLNSFRQSIFRHERLDKLMCEKGDCRSRKVHTTDMSIVCWNGIKWFHRSFSDDFYRQNVSSFLPSNWKLIDCNPGNQFKRESLSLSNKRNGRLTTNASFGYQINLMWQHSLIIIKVFLDSMIVYCFSLACFG